MRGQLSVHWCFHVFVLAVGDNFVTQKVSQSAFRFYKSGASCRLLPHPPKKNALRRPALGVRDGFVNNSGQAPIVDKSVQALMYQAMAAIKNVQEIRGQVPIFATCGVYCARAYGG